jgi:CheY-like chemotaxis protein
MSRQGRILVVDDEERWRNVLSDTLQHGGFRVDAAATTTQALERLTETFYHLLVLDIRMEDIDPDNQEGMSLLRELDRLGLGSAMQVIMLSAYGTKEQMREAFRQYEVADFLPKQGFDNLEFLKQVQEIFTNELRINLNLDVYWQEVKGPGEVVFNLEVDEARIKSDTPLQVRVADELDDLLCRLFHKAKSVMVQPLIPGYSGTGVLWVQPFYDIAGGQAMVVKFGDFHKIEEEHNNFKEYVQPFVGGGRTTTVHDLRRTSKLGGIVYSLLGTASDRLEDFGSFYRRADISQIRDVLDRLLLDTCGAWYANPGLLQPYDLAADYQKTLGFTQEKLEKALERLKAIQGKRKLHFRNLSGDRTFTNPILAVVDQPLRRSTYECITHGDFNQHNILVDKTGHVWLIDFLRTGPGHILRDAAQLDSVVRFQLLVAEEASLEERLKMEETLCSIERFSQVKRLASEFPTANRALAKAYATVVHLRTLAHKLVEQNRSDDISEYYVALLYYAMNTIRFHAVPKEQREHALFCASLLADRLGL